MDSYSANDYSDTRSALIFWGVILTLVAITAVVALGLAWLNA